MLQRMRKSLIVTACAGSSVCSSATWPMTRTSFGVSACAEGAMPNATATASGAIRRDNEK